MKRATRNKSIAVIAAACSLAFVIVGGAVPANASTLSLSGEVDGETMEWYSTPHYKATGGAASITMTAVPEFGGEFHVGFRAPVGSRTDDTQFPVVNVTGTTYDFRDPDGAPYYYFGAGTYFFDAQDQGVFEADSFVWKGTVNW